MVELAVNAERLWSTLMASAEIGRTERGGLRRLALSDEDKAMRDRFAQWVNEDGYALRIDQLADMRLRSPL